MAVQSVNYQYLWMAHWMGKSCNSVLQIYNEDGAGTGVGQASVTSMNTGCESNSRSEWYLFPLSSYNQNIDSFSTVREEYVTNSHTSRDTSSHGTVTLGTNTTDFPSSLCELASKTLEFLSEDDVSLLESIKDGPVQRQKSVGSTERESLPSSMPCLHILPGTTSSVVPYKHKARGTPAVSFMFQNKVTEEPFCRVASKDIPTHTNLTPFENETCNSCSSLTSWMCDGVKYNHLKVKNPRSSCSRQKVGALQTDDPAASKLNSLCCVDEQGREVNSSSGAGFSPSCNNPERATELEEDINPGSYLLQKMPVCCVHDEETLKICSIRNFAENVPEFPRRISQMTPHLCLTNSFGVSFSKGDQIIRESKLSTEGNATKALYELFSLSSPGRGKQGPKLQYIGHTSSSEGKKDTVDDCATRNSSHGIASFPPIKDLSVHKNLITACATFGSSREVGSRKTEIVIPNICEDTPAIMTTRGLTGKRSTWGTDSLEVENHSSHVQPPMDVNPGGELCVPEAQPNSRLVKRLKLNTRDSLAQGTRTFRTEPASSGRKVDNFFTKIMRYNITSKDLVKDQHNYRSLVLFKNLDFSSMDSVKEHEELTLSHPWIQRWRHSQPETPPMKPAARVICEPQIPKPKLKKQLPSFAAMALMGKASNRFRPCEFRKRGSVTVWNTGF
ncbi:hypothetical protein C5167_037555 [Papaver somniferum]|uniref:Uncharacterized protein n=1 Tax=Papaver somniferum TaxID=3469 RepID=A0A4Y7IB27_PAPSO|nr:uncharacterized protein LOC113288293 [Papaver somniferum]RZC44609.1 hypothetical protein C5167_037555 [Papaver somniferum]